MEALGGREPAGRAALRLQRARRRGCSACRATMCEAVAAESAARRRPASSRPARSGPSAASTFLHGFTATVAVFAAVNLGRRDRAAHRRDAAGRARRSRAPCARGAPRLVLDRAAGRGARAAGGGDRGAGGGVRPGRGRGRRALAAECGDVDMLVADAALPASGADHDTEVEHIDRALEVDLRAPIVLARPPRRGHGLPAGAATSCWSPRSQARPRARAASLYSGTKFGLRGFGPVAAHRSARHRSAGVSSVGLPGLHPRCR